MTPTNKHLIVLAALVLLWSPAAVAQPPAPQGTTPAQRAAMDKGTLGAARSAFAAGSVGVTAGQTLRVSIVNLSASNARVLCGLWTNPQPLPLTGAAACCQFHETHKLGPGEAWECDLPGSGLPTALLDKTGRAQIRAVVRSSSRAIGANVEVFDTKTGRTRVILPLREMARE